MNTEVPAYLFDLIKLSIVSAEGNREAMAMVTENAINKGADSREIMRAMFRAEKITQRTIADQNISVQRGIERLTKSSKNSKSTFHFNVKLLTSKTAI